MNPLHPARPVLLASLLCAIALSLPSAGRAQDEPEAQPARKGKKVEHPVNFVPAIADPLMGDWQGEGGYVAQVIPIGGKYQANLLTAFDIEGSPVAVLEGVASAEGVTFSGQDWSGAIKQGQFTASKGDKSFKLQHVTRTSPTLGAKPRQRRGRAL